MIRWIRQGALVMIAVCLTFCHATTAFAGEPAESPNLVYDETELEAWLDQHKETGGTVSLGTNITITKSMEVYDFHSSISVDTGKYGLVYDGSSLPSNDILITGEGVDVPVVEVLRLEDYWMEDWNNSILELNVTATGRDTMGGTALRIGCDMGGIDFTLVYSQGTIRAYGTGAVGIELVEPIDIYFFQVDVFGDGSRAVSAPNGSRLYFCRLSAEGENAAVVDEGNILLNTCLSVPAPAPVQVRHLTISESSFDAPRVFVKQNDDLSKYIFDLSLASAPVLKFSGGDGGENFYHITPVQWDWEAIYNVDTTIPGLTTIQGSLNSAFQGLGLYATPLSLIIEVRDPTLPCIYQVTPREDKNGKYFALSFWENYNPKDEDAILWRSDDEGKTWRNATWEKGISWGSNNVFISYEILKYPVWFLLESATFGKSNIVALSEKDEIDTGGKGGDRTGTDREGTLSSPDNKSGGSNDMPEGNEQWNESNSERSSTLGREGHNDAGTESDAGKVQATNRKTISITLPDSELLPTTGVSPAALEQSAPNPGFSIRTMITILLGLVIFASCALLVLRLVERRRHGKS